MHEPDPRKHPGAGNRTHRGRGEARWPSQAAGPAARTQAAREAPGIQRAGDPCEVVAETPATLSWQTWDGQSAGKRPSVRVAFDPETRVIIGIHVDGEGSDASRSGWRP